MTRTIARLTHRSRLFPERVRLIKTGQICENRGYYGNLFTLKLPDGTLAEFHRRDIDFPILSRRRTARVAQSRWNFV